MFFSQQSTVNKCNLLFIETRGCVPAGLTSPTFSMAQNILTKRGCTVFNNTQVPLLNSLWL